MKINDIQINGYICLLYTYTKGLCCTMYINVFMEFKKSCLLSVAEFLANERRRYFSNVFSHWLKPYSAWINKKQNQM